MQTITVTGNSPAATQLVSAGSGATLISNSDPANTVYLGDTSSTNPNDPSNVVPLGPNQSVVVDGSRNVYGMCSPGLSAQVYIVPGGASFFQLLTRLVLSELTSSYSGIFGYSPSPGAGNLVFSVSAIAGTDPYGNEYPAGVYSVEGYFDGTINGDQIVAASIPLSALSDTITARSLGGVTTTISATEPLSANDGDIWIDSSNGYQLEQYSSGTWNPVSWTASDVIAAGTITASLIEAGTITASLLAAGIVVSGIVDGTLIEGAEFIAGTTGNPQLDLTNLTGPGVLQFLMNNVGFTNPNITAGFNSGIAEMLISGPANTEAGFTDFVGVIMAANDGTGSNFANMDFIYTDINGNEHEYLYVDGGGAHITASDGIAAVEPGTGTDPANPAATETWHAMTGHLVNGFTAGSPAPFYKLNADNTVSFSGTIVLPSSGYNGNTFFNIPADVTQYYSPATSKRIPIAWTGTTTLNVGTPRLYVDATGYLQVVGIPAGGGSVWLDGVRYPVDI